MRYAKQAACLLLALALLAGCSGGEASSSPASRAGSAPPAETPAASAAEPKPLRSLHWGRNVVSLPDGNFFSIGQEVIPEKSKEANFTFGCRLYFNDVATMQTKALAIPKTEDGPFLAETTSSIPTLFSTESRLIMIQGNSVESLSFDLSQRETLLEEENYLSPAYQDGKYLYYLTNKVGEDTHTLKRMDLQNGQTDTSYVLEDSEYLGGCYQNKIVLCKTISEGSNYPLSIAYYTLDMETSEKEELCLIDSNGAGLLYNFTDCDRVFWQNSGENFLNQYDPATGETLQLSFGSDTYYFNSHPSWDNKLPIVAQSEDGNRSPYFYVDVETGEISPLENRIRIQSTPGEVLLTIAGEYQDQYIVLVDLLPGNTWLLGSDGITKSELGRGAELDTYLSETPGIHSVATDWVPQYALIAKDDYWQGKLDYIPFTLMV